MIALRSLKKIGIWTSFGLFPSPWGRLGWGLWWTGRTPGNSVGVALSRRRYHGRNSSLCSFIYMTLRIGNKVIIFLYRLSRTFFTANGGLFVFAAFQPATRQARMGVAGNIRERALEISPDTHGRKGRSPEKPQVFL